MEESRTKKSLLNFIVGTFSKVVIMLFAFTTKTLFIRKLGVEYNGVYGLFSNILSILALSELGIGNVLNFTLYSALRSEDSEKIKSVVSFFKKLYFIIILSISVLGLSLIPFLKYIINSDIPIEEIKIYYVLYLVNSIASYFFVYKITVITADQNNFINSICEIITTIVMYVGQIVYLLIRCDFFGYLVIAVLCTILRNIMLNIITNKKYPYLKCINKQTRKLDLYEKNKIKENIKATFIYKIAAVILNNTDNILISILVGTVYVGYYSNYYLVISYITTFVGILITSVMASLGNLNSDNNIDASFNMFNILSQIFCFIGTITTCCLINCYQSFIAFWLGTENVMPFSWVVVIAINNYFVTIMNPVWMFRETMGLFKQVKFILIITAGLNIFFSIIFGRLFSVPGILIATLISRLLSQYWYEPIILFAKLQHKVSLFYFDCLKQTGVMIISVIISFLICRLFGNSIFCILLKAFISCIIGIIIVYLFNMKRDSMNFLLKRYIQPLFANKKSN